MSNPYKSRKPIRVANESVSELDGFLARLRRLGLDDSGLSDVKEHWDDFDEDWTPERRRTLVRLPDSRLRQMIVSVDDEFEFGTITEEDADAEQVDAAYVAAKADALGRMGDTVSGILEWVAADPIRARAVADLETLPEGANRKTLVEKLDAILGDVDASVA